MPTRKAYSSGHLVLSLWVLHMFCLLRSILFPNLSLLFPTMPFEHFSVLFSLSLSVQKLIPKLSFFQKWVKSQEQGHKVKIFGSKRKVLQQKIHICYMKVQSLFVKMLCLRLSFFFKSLGQGHEVKIFGMERKVLSQGTHM